ncbi:hypothetical protein PMAYCL1PPCAC_27669, partial [Pristionchus mayeri]
LHQIIWSVELRHLSIMHYEDPIVFLDALESMRNGDYGSVMESLSDYGMDKLYRSIIDRGSGLVEDQNLDFPDEYPGQTQQLPLSHTQILA